MTENACANLWWVEMDVNKQFTKTKKMLVQQISKIGIKSKTSKINSQTTFYSDYYF
jgi:hypothetical protein